MNELCNKHVLQQVVCGVHGFKQDDQPTLSVRPTSESTVNLMRQQSGLFYMGACPMEYEDWSSNEV
jgi:hypothetical protein